MAGTRSETRPGQRRATRSASGKSATLAGHALMSEEGPEPDIKPLNVAEVPRAEHPT